MRHSAAARPCRHPLPLMRQRAVRPCPPPLPGWIRPTLTQGRRAPQSGRWPCCCPSWKCWTRRTCPPRRWSRGHGGTPRCPRCTCVACRGLTGSSGRPRTPSRRPRRFWGATRTSLSWRGGRARACRPATLSSSQRRPCCCGGLRGPRFAAGVAGNLDHAALGRGSARWGACRRARGCARSVWWDNGRGTTHVAWATVALAVSQMGSLCPVPALCWSRRVTRQAEVGRPMSHGVMGDMTLR